jgi:hypothetical protein
MDDVATAGGHGSCRSARGSRPRPAASTAPGNSTRPSTAANRPAWRKSPRSRRSAPGPGRPSFASGCRKSRGATIRRRHAPLPAAPRRRPDRGNRPHARGRRDTICISSQVGCPVDCKFCMTALLGLERSLTAGEIVGQVLLVAREKPAAGWRAAQHRDDGPGRAAAQPRERGQGHAHSARPRRLRLSPRRITVSTAESFRASPSWAASRCAPNWPSRSMPPPRNRGGNSCPSPANIT